MRGSGSSSSSLEDVKRYLRPIGIVGIIFLVVHILVPKQESSSVISLSSERGTSKSELKQKDMVLKPGLLKEEIYQGVEQGNFGEQLVPSGDKPSTSAPLFSDGDVPKAPPASPSSPSIGMFGELDNDETVRMQAAQIPESRMQRYEHVLEGVDAFFLERSKKPKGGNDASPGSDKTEEIEEWAKVVARCGDLTKPCSLPMCWANSSGFCAPSPFYFSGSPSAIKTRLSALSARKRISFCPWQSAGGPPIGVGENRNTHSLLSASSDSVGLGGPFSEEDLLVEVGEANEVSRRKGLNTLPKLPVDLLLTGSAPISSSTDVMLDTTSTNSTHETVVLLEDAAATNKTDGVEALKKKEIESNSSSLLDEERKNTTAIEAPKQSNTVLGMARSPLYPFEKSRVFDRLDTFLHFSGKVAGGFPFLPLTPPPSERSPRNPSSTNNSSGPSAASSSSSSSGSSSKLPGAQCNYYNTMFNMLAYHDPDPKGSGLYKVRNFCLAPHGPMYGYKPSISPFVGQDDAYSHRPDHPNPTIALNRWLEATRPLPVNAGCYLDTKVLFVTVWSRSGNLVHAFHRIAKMLEIRDSTFPSAGSGVLTVFLFPQGAVNNYFNDNVWDGMRFLNQTGFYSYLRVLSPTHVAVYASVFRKDKNPSHPPQWLFNEYAHFTEEMLNENPTLAQMTSTERRKYVRRLIDKPLACFREGVIYQNCLASDCLATKKSLPPVNRPSYSTFHHRSTLIQEKVIKRLRECTGFLRERKGPRRSKPHVLFTVRSSARTLVQGPYLVAVLAHYVSVAMEGELLVHEMGLGAAAPPPKNLYNLIQLYADMDIVVGPYGSALFPSIFMPPGSLVLEFGTPIFHCAKNGVNSNTRCDYGGNLILGGIHHAGFLLPSSIHRWPINMRATGPAKSHLQELGAGALIDILDTGYCIRKKNQDARQIFESSIEEEGKDGSEENGQDEAIKEGAHATTTKQNPFSGIADARGGFSLFRHDAPFNSSYSMAELGRCYRNPSPVAMRAAVTDPHGVFFRRIAQLRFPKYFQSPPFTVSSLGQLGGNLTLSYMRSFPESFQTRIPWLAAKAVFWTRAIHLNKERNTFPVLLVVPCGVRNHLLEEIDLLSTYGANVHLVAIPGVKVYNFSSFCSTNRSPSELPGDNMEVAKAELKKRTVVTCRLKTLMANDSPLGCRYPHLIISSNMISKTLLSYFDNVAGSVHKRYAEEHVGKDPAKLPKMPKVRHVVIPQYKYFAAMVKEEAENSSGQNY